MKRYTTILFSLMLALGLSSCQKFLDTPPENALLWEDAMDTPEDAQRLLTATYDVLRSGKFMGGSAWILSDLMADNMDGRGLSGDFLAYHTHNTGIFITASRELWYDGYLVVYRANLLMDRIDEVQGLADSDKGRMIAEARFLRAIGHFELVRFFGQPYGFTADNSHLGIPLRTTASTDVLPRASVGEVYTQVVADLQEAIAGLPADNGGYATAWAAKGYLAKVYFQMNMFQEAFDMADDVIRNGGFTLNNDIMARFSPTSNPENIFVLVSSSDLNNSGGSLGGNYRSTNLANPPVAKINAQFNAIATQDTNDLRRAWYVATDSATPAQRVFLTRFNDNFFSVPLVHLAEMHLIRGESAVELVDNATAEADLNAIRVRANAEPVQSGIDAASLLVLFRAERRMEMVGEGNRLHDLKRIAVNGNPNTTINGAPWDCPGMVVQIPDEETSGNGDLQLNPQGGCN